MKRSVILMGGKTYVVSLPSQWVKKYNVQKGEELEVEESDNSVIVSTNKYPEGKACEINVSEINRMLNRTIGGLYKSGYNQAKVIYESPEQLRIIEDSLRKNSIGFEITNQGKNFVIIKALTQTLSSEFENSLKRLFYTLEIMNQNLVEALKKNDEELLDLVVRKDEQVNKLADLCRRVLNSGEIKIIKKPSVVYYIVEQLERIGDIYKKIAKLRNLNITEEFLINFSEINDFFIDYRKLYYDFSLENLEIFGKKFDSLKKKINYHEDHQLKLYQELLLESIFDMNGALITINI